jgi:hypothetical protein
MPEPPGCPVPRTPARAAERRPTFRRAPTGARSTFGADVPWPCASNEVTIRDVTVAGSGRKRSASLRAVATTVGLATLVAALIWTLRASAPAATSPPFFGTLVTEPANAQTEARVGIKVAMLEVHWDRFEPALGRFDAAYITDLRNRLAAFRRADMRVTLGLGLTSAPQWAYSFPNARFRDQHGRTSGEVNLVFNEPLRQQVDRYFARLASGLGVSNLWAIRLTSGGDGEVLYPPGGSYWAFDANAQNGSGMPPSMDPNPYPGWKPGTATLNTAQVGRWADWYVQALDDVVDWQIRTWNRLGFRGYYQVLTPGSGTRPDGFDYDIQHHLPDGVTGVGAVWDRFYGFLPDKRRVMAYVTSVADLSARNRRDDSCQTGDESVPLTSHAADNWSATRWISRIAGQWGLPKAGENPGWNQGGALSRHYVDTSSHGMMADAIRQLVSCHFQGFYWASDKQVWDNVVPLSRYAAAISEAVPGGALTPAWPAEAPSS